MNETMKKREIEKKGEGFFGIIIKMERKVGNNVRKLIYDKNNEIRKK